MSDGQGPAPERPTPSGVGMETVVGYILLIGVLLSVGLIVSGVCWHWAVAGHLVLTYPAAGMNLLQFVVAEMRQLISGPLAPRTIIYAGLVVLMLTPYGRVLASLAYFAFVERNWKYTALTAFVLGVLTYSLFLH
jgi:uncharacterized membrane protein